MSNFIPVQTPGGTIWVEVDEGVDFEKLELTGIHEKALKNLEEMSEAIKNDAKFLLDKMAELSPAEVEISFGIKAGAEAGIPFFALAKASGESNFTFTMKWVNSKRDGA